MMSFRISVKHDGILPDRDEIKKLVDIALNKAALNLIAAFDDNSPVDSGAFRGEWDFKEETPTGDTIASVSVFNRSAYAAVIEFGSPAGEAPWPSATGEKTIELDGRIWSTQAVGGVAGPVLGDEGGFADKLQNQINDFVFG